jgi:MarR family transcriptional regulator, organic hydroperoxide resistance regulator
MSPLNEFRYLVLATQRDGQRLLAEALRPLGVTPAQAEVLSVLARRAPLSLHALGERLVCETGSPSRLVAAMVAAGWLARRSAPDDARRILFSLTPAGSALATQAAAVEAEFLVELESLLAGAPLGALNAALWRVVSPLPAGKALRLRLAEETPGPPALGAAEP